MAASSSRQAEILEHINKIKVNFGKDPLSRKTPEYIERRLETLDNLWGEFEENHKKLSEQPEKEPKYFGSNYYQQGKEFYQATRTLLSSFIAKEKSTQSCGEADELLSLQRTNFRAFNRLVKSIAVDTIDEKWELEDELKSIQSKWDSIDSLHLRIDHILQGTDVSYEDEFNALEVIFKSTKRALNQKISSMVHVQKSTPKLDIPTFTGKYSQWPTFCDLFTEAIHDNNAITKAQKMQHLKGKVKGEPERLIQHLHIAADNYDTAWEILTHRYNNTQVLFTNQIETFLNQPIIQKQTAFELKRLYDTSTECIHAIHNLGVDTNTWDPLLVHILCKKLDQDTYCDYKEARKSPRELPCLTEFMSFIEGKFIALEPISRRAKEQSKPVFSHGLNQTKNKSQEGYYKKQYKSTATQGPNCPLCNTRHNIFFCRKFRSMTPENRLATITKGNLCKNCLYNHFDSDCTSSKRCKTCDGDHNTLLHDAFAQHHQATSTVTSGMSSTQSHSLSPHNVNHVAADNEEVLLTTLKLNVRASNGTYITLRALLDQGSQISLISENATQLLGLQRRQYHASISGIGPVAKQSKGIVSLDCKSIYGDYILTTQALVVSRVINDLPNSTFYKQSWAHLHHLKLADPEYNVTQPIDLLLDASVYSEIILGGLIKGPTQSPIAQQTKMGWILSGNVKRYNCHVVINNIPDSISKYWELEDVDHSSSTLSTGDQFCEDFYKNTTRRLENGRYEVGLPMMPDFKQHLGASKYKAIAQFKQLENKMLRNKSLATQYKQFVHEYKDLNHMTEVDYDEDQGYFLPHHGVWKHDSTTTKLRVVFNASAKTTSGKSLNDLMFCGPNLQQDLLSLIISWRKYKYVMTADIEKMFRQLLIRDCDQYLQSIIWRDSLDEPLKQYRLTTVTYGTKAAPFLAMRTLKQLAIDDVKRYPLAASVVQNSFYMDDLLSGHNCINKAKELQKQLIKMLQGAGMNLRKWSSNHSELLRDLTSDQLNSPYEFKCFESRKTLGLKWNPSSDTFLLECQITSESNKNITKRQLLSDISKIFDPLGWLAPLTIRAKILFQETWSEKTSWDQELSKGIIENWLKLREDIKNINRFCIPRHLGNLDKNCQLHAFCDASDKAYACTIYLVTYDKGEYTSNLVAAKTKLAPVAKKISLPRLELCGALLLTQLVKKVVSSLPSHHMTIHAWTDSMIVLGWLDGDIARWKPFVANRVQQITNIIPSRHWNHVSSEENAADCATRGLTTAQLLNHSLWWAGPIWLKQFDSKKVKKVAGPAPTIELKTPSVNAALNDLNISFITDLLHKHSSLTRTVRIIGWVARFIARIQKKQIATYHNYLSSIEITNAYNIIIREVQTQDFAQELRNIQLNKCVHPKSRICSLNPFVDNDGILRVGGRLKHARLSNSAKHPIILSNHSRFTNLLIDLAHITTLHGGPRLTLSYIRDRYWIISGVRTVKRQLRLCIRCRRFNNTDHQQIMADLPEARVTPARPFTHTGVDFTGHVELKANKGRGIKTVKGYVAVFVCMSTKAVHLELVSDLGTPAFLAAFRRFCARRGSPSHMYSDNGRNFIGANRLIKKEYMEIIHCINSDFFNNIGEMNIKWHFNAPAWPNAGGLWEAAVKSLKYHLKRVLGDQRLTYEEFSTLLCQIEACLNSRPLCQLSEDTDAIDCLTPGHFLVGGPIMSRPATDPGSITLTSRWQLVQGMIQNIWKRWSLEYLQQLQTRTKWRQAKTNVEVNDIVLIKEENLAPGKWAMARVQQVHSGKDGYVRVVTLKTSNNILQRPVNKLVPLPINEIDMSSKSPSQQDQSSSSSDQVENQNRPVRTRRKATWKAFMITALFLFTFISPTVQQTSYNITPITTNQGLYFDRMSDLQIIKDDWKLIVYYNMSTYYRAITDISNYVTHLKKTVDNMGHQYDSVILQLDHEIKEIKHYHLLLQSPFLSRHKRGLINGVGYLANSLFGVLDERFAEQYKQDIERIAQNENHVQKLLRNQTLILESEYNILRRNEVIMHKQFDIINNHLRNVSLELNRVTMDNRNSIYVTSTALAASIILSNLMRIQHILIDTVTDISHGRIDPYLLSPEQLSLQVNIISGQLQGTLDIPVESSNLSDLYKIIKASSRLHDNYLIIEIRIPLVNSDIYELDKIISIPQKRESNHVRIVSTLPYIAYNVQRDTALLLSDMDLQACIHVSSNEKILCSLDKPVYNLKIKQSLCDLPLISSETTCKQEILSTCHNNWFKLHNTNSWLYSCCEICHLRLFCSSDSTTTILRDSGIINLGHGCTLKTDDYSIHTHNNFLRQLYMQPNIEAPKVSVLNSLINTTLPDHFVIPENHTEVWNQLQEQINNVKEQSSTELNVHDVHHYSVAYLTLALMVAFGSIGLYIFMKNRNKGTEQPPQGVTIVANAQSQHSPPGKARVVLTDASESVSEGVLGMISACREVNKSVISVDKGTSPMVTHRSVDFSFLNKCEQD